MTVAAYLLGVPLQKWIFASPLHALFAFAILITTLRISLLVREALDR